MDGADADRPGPSRERRGPASWLGRLLRRGARSDIACKIATDLMSAPAITVTAIQAAGLVSGLVVIETLFNYPGIGQLLINSAVNHDIPVLEAATLLIGLIIMMANLFADISYGLIDPRTQHEAAR